MPQQHRAVSCERQLVLVVQDVLRTAREPFDSYADLKADVKAKLSRLHLPYDSGRLAEALDQVERGGRRPAVESER